MMDRIETVYMAIDQMAATHGTDRPANMGGGKWDFDEEIKIWKAQIIRGEKADARINPLTPLQWGIINSYIKEKRNDLGLSWKLEE